MYFCFQMGKKGQLTSKHAQDYFQERRTLYVKTMTLLYDCDLDLETIAHAVTHCSERATSLPEPFTSQHIWADGEEQTDLTLLLFSTHLKAKFL